MSSSPLAYPAYAQRSSFNLTVWLRAWLPVLAFSMVFAIESTSYFGRDRTSEPLLRVAETVFGYGIGAFWETIHHILRKGGHVAGYGMFSLVCFRALWVVGGAAASRLRRKLRAHGLAIFLTFLLGSADEIHQTFLPNRYGAVSDVLLDTSGAVTLGLLLFLAMLAADRWRARRKKLPHRFETTEEAPLRQSA